MTPAFYASLRLIILRDIAWLRGQAYPGEFELRNGFRGIRARQRDLARLRALRSGTATEL